MADNAQFEKLVEPIAAWARSRPELLGVALVGSWARGTARPDSDVDLILLASEPQAFRYDDQWLADIAWRESRVASWHDADYGAAWSRHVALEPRREIEFTFCAPSWAATDPVDPGTAHVMSGGCRILLDKIGLLASLRAVVTP